MAMIESMGIPLVVLNGPPTFQEPTVAHISEEIRIVGEAFGKGKEAAELAGYLEGVIDMIRSRTAGADLGVHPDIGYPPLLTAIPSGTAYVNTKTKIVTH